MSNHFLWQKKSYLEILQAIFQVIKVIFCNLTGLKAFYLFYFLFLSPLRADDMTWPGKFSLLGKLCLAPKM